MEFRFLGIESSCDQRDYVFSSMPLFKNFNMGQRSSVDSSSKTQYVFWCQQHNALALLIRLVFPHAEFKFGT